MAPVLPRAARKLAERLRTRRLLRNYRLDSPGRWLDEVARSAGGTDRLPTWDMFSREIDYYASRYDLCTFMQWPPIAKSMVVDSRFVDIELAELQSSAHWPRFSDALVDRVVGMPRPYPPLPYSTANLVHHAYHLHRFEAAFARLDRNATVLEFGGGYGSMCRLIANYAGFDRYLIYDLPALSAIQRYFLAAALDAEACAAVEYVTATEELADLEPDLFISTWGLSEVPLALRKVFEPIIARSRHVLIAYQADIDGIDNQEYFRALSATTGHRVAISEIAHKRRNFYLLGTRA